jgi:hypothetical protein
MHISLPSSKPLSILFLVLFSLFSGGVGSSYSCLLIGCYCVIRSEISIMLVLGSSLNSFQVTFKVPQYIWGYFVLYAGTCFEWGDWWECQISIQTLGKPSGFLNCMQNLLCMPLRFFKYVKSVLLISCLLLLERIFVHLLVSFSILTNHSLETAWCRHWRATMMTQSLFFSFRKTFS